MYIYQIKRSLISRHILFKIFCYFRKFFVYMIIDILKVFQFLSDLIQKNFTDKGLCNILKCNLKTFDLFDKSSIKKKKQRRRHLKLCKVLVYFLLGRNLQREKKTIKQKNKKHNSVFLQYTKFYFYNKYCLI